MLEVLRSLAPGAGAPAKGASSDRTDQGRASREPARPEPEPTPAPAPAPPDRRLIRLRAEEVGVFLLAGVVLVVTAFLMGWHGRGEGPSGADLEGAGARPPPLAVDPRPDVPQARAQAPLARTERGTDPDGDLGSRPRGVARASRRSGAAYAILVAKFPRGGTGEAQDHMRSLKQRGYPARLRSTAEGIELCVGRFHSPADSLARQWVPKLRTLSPAYSSAGVVRIP